MTSIPSPSASLRLWLTQPQSRRHVHPLHPTPITRHDTCLVQQCYYDFKYDDEDTVLNELEEFYSYVEMPQAAENLKAWEGSFQGGLCVFVLHNLSRRQLKSPCGKNGPGAHHKGAEHTSSFYSRA
jgi:hypothetical protein